MAYNKWINTFSTQAEYEEYIAGDVDQYPSISFVESTNSVYILDEEPEPEPVFSIKVLDDWGNEYSDGATIEGNGEQYYLFVEGYLDGEQIFTDDFSVTANNDLVFSDGSTNYQAELPYGYNSTYNYTITATCSGQTVTFSLTYVQASTPSIDYSISVRDVEEGGQLVPNEEYWVELSSEQETPAEPFDGEFVVECSGEGHFTYNFDRDDDGGVDGTLTFDGAEDGDTITISYVQDGVTLASASYVANVQRFQLQVYTDGGNEMGYQVDTSTEPLRTLDYYCIYLYDREYLDYKEDDLDWSLEIFDEYGDTSNITIQDGDQHDIGFSNCYAIISGDAGRFRLVAKDPYDQITVYDEKWVEFVD